ncbi:DUF4265 domain-containing protein [Burkholderia plantarii]|uniref:DUF4265 domain-containing protein n=1 Tax=Burkholderia plantarii TaxID=41899 RepID=UPI000706DCDF|nr:DUF4265 domain-containing protein [Burkholderia plantarii]ALK30273.1 low molecular weight phosphotyrosine protein phosphatase [Burkholderia plantarii]GLZ18383.1 hypothetical protein Bpla01_19130 [Burkholderia plantarii]
MIVENWCLIDVYAGNNESGPVYERLPAKQIDANVYKLLASPGLTLNLAKGDLIRLDGVDLPATVVMRGGNFCIQIYSNEISKDDAAWLEAELKGRMNGALDSMNEGSLACSVPAVNGIGKINELFNEFKRRSGVEWYYSNIYKNFEDPSDETLLNWWVVCEK